MPAKLFLFDLDGTLIDTAPDLVHAANLVRTVRGLPALPFEEMRPLASRGAPGLIGHAFNITKTDERFPALRDEFLENYRQSMTALSRPFDGIIPMLDTLRAAGIKVGIVTNKYERLALALVHGLHLTSHFDIILGSDSYGCAMKPAPDSFFTAAKKLGISLSETLYAGDDPRDVDGAHAAGIPCAAVRWGYLPSNPDTWRAEFVADTPHQLVTWALAFHKNSL